MTTKAKFPGNTIQLSDTVDQWGAARFTSTSATTR